MYLGGSGREALVSVVVWGVIDIDVVTTHMIKVGDDDVWWGVVKLRQWSVVVVVVVLFGCKLWRREVMTMVFWFLRIKEMGTSGVWRRRKVKEKGGFKVHKEDS